MDYVIAIALFVAIVLAVYAWQNSTGTGKVRRTEPQQQPPDSKEDGAANSSGSLPEGNGRDSSDFARQESLFQEPLFDMPSGPAGNQAVPGQVRRPEIGNVIWEFGKARVGEFGVSSGDTVILWDEVAAVYIGGATHTDRWGNSARYDTREIKVRSPRAQGGEVKLKLWKIVDRLDAQQLDEYGRAYAYIIDHVMDRHWRWLVRWLDEGNAVSFGRMVISADVVQVATLLGGYDVIHLRNLAGCYTYEGELYIEYYEGGALTKKYRKVGAVSSIANLHLARAFIETIAARNRAARGVRS